MNNSLIDQKQEVVYYHAYFLIQINGFYVIHDQLLYLFHYLLFSLYRISSFILILLLLLNFGFFLTARITRFVNFRLVLICRLGFAVFSLFLGCGRLYILRGGVLGCSLLKMFYRILRSI